MVTVQLALFLFAVAVMVTVPAETEVTFPFASTVATFMSELSHTTFFVAPLMVAFNCSVFTEVPP